MDAPPYQPYLEAPPPFRWRLGVRPLDLADWIEIDDRYADEIAAKHRIMREHPDTAFVVLDGEDVTAASAEVLALVADHLSGLGDERVVDVEPDTMLHPLDAAARLVQEDLVLLVERDGGLVCAGGSVCFPNRWDLRSKVGRSMSAIHAPVADLNEQLEPAIDAFLDRLRPDRSFWRLGWGVLDTDELYQAVDGTAPARPTAPTPGQHHLRVERETLRRLPRTGAVLFTIRTHLTPLPAVPVDGGAIALADAIEALPPDVAVYKQLDEVGDELVGWLRSRVAAASSTGS